MVHYTVINVALLSFILLSYFSSSVPTAASKKARLDDEIIPPRLTNPDIVGTRTLATRVERRNHHVLDKDRIRRNQMTVKKLLALKSRRSAKGARPSPSPSAIYHFPTPSPAFSRSKSRTKSAPLAVPTPVTQYDFGSADLHSLASFPSLPSTPTIPSNSSIEPPTALDPNFLEDADP